jgi:lipoyl synthase
MLAYKRKPEWLRINRLVSKKKFINIDNLLQLFDINTVCDKALCPNKNYCLSRKELTFLILGKYCTRNCKFCNIETIPLYSDFIIDVDEPEKLAFIINKLKLEYVVITSVTRDDLDDGGMTQYINCVEKIKMYNNVKIELLCPDFKGKDVDILNLINSGIDVFAHNLETVPSLYNKIRIHSDYFYSLNLLKKVKSLNNELIVKTGFMLGLGETNAEVENLIDDIADTGCDVLTIGQYLPPSKSHYPVSEYIEPELFKYFKDYAENKNINFVLSSPFVRSSFRAKEVYYDYYEKFA